MKKISLKRLELTNYRNIEYAIYEFDGDSKIIGENRIGKTNTLESIYWLLTDKLLDGSSDVSAIKPLKDTKLEVRVKATFDVDGKEVTLEKDYKENWVKTRGTTDVEMKGHTITWIHNGVKQSTLKAYNQLVCEDFGFTQDATTKIDFMQMLINPFYLGSIGEGKEWTELRSFIIKLVGDVSDEDIVAAKPELRIVKADLDSVGGRIDQLKKKYSNDIDTLKTQIISDEGQVKLLEETPNPTDDEVAIAKKGIEEHQDKITVLKGNSGLDIASMEISNKINQKKIEFGELEKQELLKAQENSGAKELQDKLTQLHSKQSELLTKKHDLQRNMSDLQWNLKEKETDLKDYQDYRLALIADIKKLDSEMNDPKFESECPHCHRPYDEATLEDFRERFINDLKAKRENFISQGKNTKAKIDALAAEIESLKSQDYEKELEEVEKELSSTSEEINHLRLIGLNSLKTPVEESPLITSCRKEIADLEEEYRISKENYLKGIQDNQQLIYEEEQAMIPFKKVLADRDYYRRQMEKLVFINSNLKFHSRELADIEQKKELLNMFVYTKLKMLDENVSKVFGAIKFQLIKENINGGYDAICKPYIYDTVKETSTSISWKSGSKSERVVTGIAIAEAIKSKLELPNLPFLFDEGGEVSVDTFKNRIKTDSQLICVKIADNIMSPLVQKL